MKGPDLEASCVVIRRSAHLMVGESGVPLRKTTGSFWWKEPGKW